MMAGLPELTTAEPGTQPASASASPPGVLVIDDSPTIRESVARVLTDSGCQVVTAPDGASGLALLDQAPVDLVVVDIVLPGLSGFEVCRRLRARQDSDHLKIVLLTGKEARSDRFWGLRQGADAYVTKPLEAALLPQLVGRLLSERAASQLEARELAATTANAAGSVSAAAGMALVAARELS